MGNTKMIYHYINKTHGTRYTTKFSTTAFNRALVAREMAEFSRELDIPDKAALKAYNTMRKTLCPDFIAGCDCTFELEEK